MGDIKILRLAEAEARRLKHEYVGTEHILFGLAREGNGVGARVLLNLKMDLNALCEYVLHYAVRGFDDPTLAVLALTPRAKKAVEFASEEARLMNHRYIGSEHLLLGLLRDQETFSAAVLMNHCVTLAKVRQELVAVLGAVR